MEYIINEKEGTIKIKTTFGHIVVEVCKIPEISEVYIGLENEKGEYTQDIAVISQDWFLGNNIIEKSDSIKVVIYGKAGNEDCTDIFNIDVYKGDDE